MKSPTFAEFLRLFVGDTASLISGGLSVPLTVMSLFSNNKYAKVSFGILALAGLLIASYRLWAGERLSALALQSRLVEEINKRGRPEITVELKSDSSVLYACLINYSSIAAINVKIDDTPCANGVLRFENIPTMISSEFSPNLHCCFVPSNGGPERTNVVQELIFSDMPKLVLTIRYTDSDGVLDWLTKCDFAYDPKQKKIVLLKQWIEDGDAENAIQEFQNYNTQRARPSQRSIKWLHDRGYVKTTRTTHMQSPGEEYLITSITEEGKSLLKRKPVGEPQRKLLDAQLEEIEAREKARKAEEEREARMQFLTAPDTGIREFVAAETLRKNCQQVFTTDTLASAVTASKSEIEEALRLLRSQGFAKETSLPGHWFIQS